MWRNMLLASVLLVVVIANFVRVTHNQLGWGGYWDLELIAPWQR